MAKQFDVVIDTNLYAGNFERELCAYCTGVWDGETHGGEQAAIFNSEVDNDPFGHEAIELRPDDEHGWMAPQHLELTPPDRERYNSVAIHFEAEPTAEQIALIKERSRRFASEGKIFDLPVTGLEILGFRIIERTQTEVENHRIRVR